MPLAWDFEGQGVLIQHYQVLVTRTGGMPLQVQHEQNGFLVDPEDQDAVARHLYDLFSDADLYDRISNHGRANVSDEVNTVGNAMSWLYLFSELIGPESSGCGYGSRSSSASLPKRRSQAECAHQKKPRIDSTNLSSPAGSETAEFEPGSHERMVGTEMSTDSDRSMGSDTTAASNNNLVGRLKPNMRWINDLAREAAGEPYGPGEPRLPRDLAL